MLPQLCAVALCWTCACMPNQCAYQSSPLSLAHSDSHSLFTKFTTRKDLTEQSQFSGSVYYTGQKHQTGFVNKLYRSTCYMYQQTLTAEVTDFNGGLKNLNQNLPYSQLQLTKWKDFCFHLTTKISYWFLRAYCYPWKVTTEENFGIKVRGRQHP